MLHAGFPVCNNDYTNEMHERFFISISRDFFLLTGSTSQIMTDMSFEPVASLSPSGENLQYQTSSQ